MQNMQHQAVYLVLRPPCDENQQTFPEHHATDQRTVVMDVGGGTQIAGPWDGEPSNSVNKL